MHPDTRRSLKMKERSACASYRSRTDTILYTYGYSDILQIRAAGFSLDSLNNLVNISQIISCFYLRKKLTTGKLGDSKEQIDRLMSAFEPVR